MPLNEGGAISVAPPCHRQLRSSCSRFLPAIALRDQWRPAALLYSPHRVSPPYFARASFLKKVATSLLRYGLVARHVT